MTFLRPEFLYGLIAIIIPVIIHLFNFRRHKKLYFSDISRLKSVSIRTKKKQKLKHLIVLSLRILSIAFIVIALAGPINKSISTIAKETTGVVTIFIDNSYSMLSEGSNGRLFESARIEALDIVNQSPDNSNFIIISNSNDISNNRTLDKEAAISHIEELSISSGSKTISQFVLERNRVLQRNELISGSTYIISDFQKNITDINDIEQDTIGEYFLLPLSLLNNKNIYIEDCQLLNTDLLAGSVIDVKISIKNDSDSDYEKVPVKLTIDGQQKAVAGIDIPSGATKDITLSFSVSKPGWHKGVVAIEDFPITFDDKLLFTFNVVSDIRILLVGENDNNEILKKFYTSDEVFNVKEMDYRSIDLSLLANNDLVILNSLPKISTGISAQLMKFIVDGGTVLFIPPTQDYIDNISEFLGFFNAGNVISIDTSNTRVTGLKLSNPLFTESIIRIPQNAELPNVNKHYRYSFAINSGIETLASLLIGDDFLSVKKIGSGHLYILSVGLDKSYGNFTSQLLFAPVMHGIASKRRIENAIYYTLGTANSIVLNSGNIINSESPHKLVSDDQEIIPGQKSKNNTLTLDLGNINLQNDFYELRNSDTITHVLAFNFNRAESDMNFYTTVELEEICSKSGIKNFTVTNIDDPGYKEVINASQKESDFWKLFIIFALFTLLFEIIVLRFWKG